MVTLHGSLIPSETLALDLRGHPHPHFQSLVNFFEDEHIFLGTEKPYIQLTNL